MEDVKISQYAVFRVYPKGESYNGSMTVSKTVHGGSNPSSPVLIKAKRLEDVKISQYAVFRVYPKGESYNGSMTVSKTVHGGSNPSSPVLIKAYEF